MSNVKSGSAEQRFDNNLRLLRELFEQTLPVRPYSADTKYNAWEAESYNKLFGLAWRQMLERACQLIDLRKDDYLPFCSDLLNEQTYANLRHDFSICPSVLKDKKKDIERMVFVCGRLLNKGLSDEECLAKWHSLKTLARMMPQSTSLLANPSNPISKYYIHHMDASEKEIMREVISGGYDEADMLYFTCYYFNCQARLSVSEESAKTIEEHDMVSATDVYPTFTMKIDDREVALSKVNDFVRGIREIKPMKAALALFDAMIICGLVKKQAQTKAFVDDINKMAGREIIKYDSCQRWDDLEFHKKIERWDEDQIMNERFLDRNEYESRMNLVRQYLERLRKMI